MLHELRWGQIMEVSGQAGREVHVINYNLFERDMGRSKLFPFKIFPFDSLLAFFIFQKPKVNWMS